MAMGPSATVQPARKPSQAHWNLFEVSIMGPSFSVNSGDLGSKWEPSRPGERLSSCNGEGATW